MPITKDSVVTLDYRLTDDEGEVLDESGSTPLIYLHGRGHLVVGLERALTGLSVGDEATVRVAPEDGYGLYDQGQVLEVDRSELPEDIVPEVGMEVAAESEDGSETAFWIASLDDNAVVLDGNHPLAGVPLTFQVTIRAIRPATPAELASGLAEESDADVQALAPKM